MGELIKALYKHYKIKPTMPGYVWVVLGSSWDVLNTDFISTDKGTYYLTSSRDRPHYACIPFDLFIRDEYES